MNIPQWWLVLSGVFFALSILLVFGLLIALFFLIGAIKEIGQKVSALTSRVESMTAQVEELVETVQVTTRGVGQRAVSISDSAALISRGLAQKTDIIATGFLVLNVLRRILAARRR